MKFLKKHMSKRHLLILFPFAFSVIVLANLIFCLAFPSHYPIENLDDKIRLSDASEAISSEYGTFLKKIANFMDIPMNTKFTYEIQLSSLSEVNIYSRAEMYITENATLTINHIPAIDSVSYQNMSDVEVSLDGIKQILTVAEIGGKKFYVLPSYNLTRKNEVRTLLFAFRYNVPPEPNPLVRIPILFNDKYVQAVGAPSCTIGVEKNTTSDKCELRVHFNIPFRRILVEQSGWSDYFVSKDILTSDQSSFDAFKYPIEQEIEVNDRTYSFSTYFSEENNANGVSLTSVPDLKFPIFIAFLLASPFFVYLFGLLTKDNKQDKSSKKNANSKFQKLKNFSLILLKAYSFPLVTIGIYFGIGASDFLPMLGYLTEIMNPIILGLVLIYPAIFSLAYFVWKR